MMDWKALGPLVECGPYLIMVRSAGIVVGRDNLSWAGWRPGDAALEWSAPVEGDLELGDNLLTACGHVVVTMANPGRRKPAVYIARDACTGEQRWTLKSSVISGFEGLTCQEGTVVIRGTSKSGAEILRVDARDGSVRERLRGVHGEGVKAVDTSLFLPSRKGLFRVEGDGCVQLSDTRVSHAVVHEGALYVSTGAPFDEVEVTIERWAASGTRTGRVTMPASTLAVWPTPVGDRKIAVFPKTDTAVAVVDLATEELVWSATADDEDGVEATMVGPTLVARFWPRSAAGRERLRAWDAQTGLPVPVPDVEGTPYSLLGFDDVLVVSTSRGIRAWRCR